MGNEASILTEGMGTFVAEDDGATNAKDNDCPKKNVSFAQPVVTSLRYRPKFTREDRYKLFFQKDELAKLQQERRSQVYEEQFETIVRSDGHVQIAFPRRQKVSRIPFRILP